MTRTRTLFVSCAMGYDGTLLCASLFCDGKVTNWDKSQDRRHLNQYPMIMWAEKGIRGHQSVHPDSGRVSQENLRGKALASTSALPRQPGEREKAEAPFWVAATAGCLFMLECRRSTPTRR